MSKSNNLNDFLESMANFIRNYTGSSDLIDPQDFETQLANIISGGGGGSKEILLGVLSDEIDVITAEDLEGLDYLRDSAFYSMVMLEYITLPNTLEGIGRYAFYDTSITEIEIPDAVVTIGDGAFKNCALSQVIISDNSSLYSIGSYAFWGCYSLESITLPQSINMIGSEAFYDCNALESITILATTPPTLSNANAFSNTNNCSIYVHAGSVSAYRTATNWASLASRIQAILE